MNIRKKQLWAQGSDHIGPQAGPQQIDKQRQGLDLSNGGSCRRMPCKDRKRYIYIYIYNVE